MCTNRYISNSFNNNTNSSNGGFGTASYGLPLSNNLSYGNAYVPVQTLRTVYSPSEGLAYGTMFPELVSPYYPNQSMSEINYLRNYNERGCQ